MTESKEPDGLGGRRIHPALHFEHDFASVGIVDYERVFWIVTSDRQIIPADQPGIMFETPPLVYHGIANRWDVADLNDFVANGEVHSFGETVDLIRNVIAYYCDLQYREESALIAYWIMGTYFHPLFPTFPRLYLHGERGTAKSKVLSLIAAMAFNGLLRLNPTPATLFRLIHPVRPTLCLDEIETLAGHDKAELLSIVNSGYKRGAAVDRCMGEKHDLHTYQVYSPVTLAGIAGLNSVTEDRAITIVTVRGRDRDKVNREVISEDPVFQQIRNGCYRLVLSVFGLIEQTRQEFTLPDWLVGRHRELYGPVLSVAALADRDGGLGLTSDLSAIAEHELPHRSGRSFESEAVLTLLREQLAKQDPYQARPGEVALLLEGKLGHRVTAEKAGHMLRRLGFERMRDAKGSYYLVTSDRINEVEGGS